MALCAKLYLDGGIFFLISRSEISKMMSLPKYNLARSTKKYFMALCAKLYLDGGIFFFDFAKQNQKKDASIQRIFRRRRRQNTL